MKKLVLVGFLFAALPVYSMAAVVGTKVLDTAQVTTSGTPVVAAAAGTVFSGCWIQNDPSSTTNLIVDSVGTANKTTPTSTSAILTPGQTFYCPGGITTAITVDALDNAHKFYGQKW